MSDSRTHLLISAKYLLDPIYGNFNAKKLFFMLHQKAEKDTKKDNFKQYFRENFVLSRAYLMHISSIICAENIENGRVFCVLSRSKRNYHRRTSSCFGGS